MKFILGYKQEMTQTFKDNKVIPMTVIKVDDCYIVQKKIKEKDGYSSVQVGCGSRKKISKPLQGHFKKSTSKNQNLKYLKEFRVENSDFPMGSILDISSFQPGDKVDVVATSKGKGFQGVVKRHGFAGQTTSHGTKDQVRMPGSIGATGPAHVFKGTRMGGQMGNARVTTKNLEIIEVDKDNGLLKLKGAVPGHRNTLVMLKGDGEMKILEIKPKDLDKKETATDDKNKNDIKPEKNKDDNKKEENK